MRHISAKIEKITLLVLPSKHIIWFENVELP